MAADYSHLKEDLAYQTEILQDVSRTFALTIPELPSELRIVVGNGYLLCRIADTIEDEEGLSAQQKREFSDRWFNVLKGTTDAETFSRDLGKLLTLSATEREIDLIDNVNRVVRITNSFSEPQKKALLRCVDIMADGMAVFQQNASLEGLTDLDHLNRYCYHVAGVVGEMLTELFCDYSDEIATHKDALFTLSSSFGQGLQMTNILKDIWEDHRRGACWLPRSVFQENGFDLHSLSPDHTDPGFTRGMNTLIAVARQHLNNALQYTLLIPAHEVGIRRFCLWALGMAVLTLRKTYNTPTFKSGQDVKITRRTVKAVVVSTSVLARFDSALKLLHFVLSRGLPRP
ncbi:MAG: phytoene/squalene synthase family protein [Bacteroidetes bacterium]|nr:phytoene/squalene synthase family protein [Bacteroidota bacterium]MCY4204990.1 phytoene/squalene synthase family protein [Bacteroidota bacterium]